jgi:hypothetical protein
MTLSSNLTILVGGFKHLDGRATNPLTGLPIFVDSKRQSRDHCIPFIILFGKDKKDVYTEVMKDPFFNFFSKLDKEGLPANGERGWPAIDPNQTEVVSPQDIQFSSF